MTTEASAEYRQRIQGVRDDDEGGSGLTTGPMDWQQQHSVYFLAIALLTVTLSRLCIFTVYF